jgi:hypothetical protein
VVVSNQPAALASQIFSGEPQGFLDGDGKAFWEIPANWLPGPSSPIKNNIITLPNAAGVKPAESGGQPQCFIESMAHNSQVRNPRTGTFIYPYFRVTARGFGINPSTIVVLQSEVQP